MVLVLAVTDDNELGKRLRDGLGAEGWWVSQVEDRQAALRSAADQEPQLVLIDDEIDGTADLVRVFGSRGGGPGAVVLSGEVASAPGARHADSVLAKGSDHQALLSEAKKVMSQPHSPVAAGKVQEGAVLSAEDIFAEVLEEVTSAGTPPPPPDLPDGDVDDIEPVAEETSPRQEPEPEIEMTSESQSEPEPEPEPELAAAPEPPSELEGSRESEPAPVGMQEPEEAEEPEEPEEPAVQDMDEATPDPPDSSNPVTPVDPVPEVDAWFGDAFVEPPPVPGASAAAEVTPDPPLPPPWKVAVPPPSPDLESTQELSIEALSELATGAELEIEGSDTEPTRPSEPPVPASSETPEAHEEPVVTERVAADGGGDGWKRFWLGVAAGLLVFAITSLLLRATFGRQDAAPAADPEARAAASQTGSVAAGDELEELVERELERREDELRKALVEEERRLQERLEEAAGEAPSDG